MAKYTTELRTILNNQDDYFELWDFDFPIFDESYRDVLIKKINDHYFMREIGSETVGLFKHYLRTTMNEIMPNMNLLYKHKLETIDPFVTYKLKETSKRTNKGQSQGESQTAGDTANVELYSDTPQGNTEIRKGKHLTSVTDTDTKQSALSTSNQSVNNTEDFVKDLVGNTSGKSDVKLLIEFRNAIIDVDMMIIDALGDLFMNVF